MKRKNEETPSSSSSRASKQAKTNAPQAAPRKTWYYSPLINYPSINLTMCEKGCLNAQQHVYVEQTNFITEHFIKVLQDNFFFSLQGSPNSGKTSMIVNSVIPWIRDQSKSNTHFQPLHVDLEQVMLNYSKRKNNESFHHCFMVYILKLLNSTADAPQSLFTLFSLSAPYCRELKRKKLILFLDHADALHKLPYEVRRSFIESWLSISANSGQYNLFSVTVIGNSVINVFSIRDEERNGMVHPFSAHVTIPHLTRDEYIHFIKSFITVPIQLDVVNRIYDRYTFGHIGQSIIMIKYYQFVWEEAEKAPKVDQWEDDILSDNFWEFLKIDESFSRIFDSLNDDKLMDPLISWIQDERKRKTLALDLSIEDALARLGLIQFDNQKKVCLTSLLMRDLVESTYTKPPEL